MLSHLWFLTAAAVGNNDSDKDCCFTGGDGPSAAAASEGSK